MIIRRPSAAERAPVQAMVEEVVEETYGGQWAEPPLEAREEDWTRGWAAEVDGAIVGIALTADDWLDDLWVTRSVRSRGVGAALLAHAEREIAARGHATAVLRVVATNTRALAFYLREGWAEARRYRHERYPVEMIELRKSLAGRLVP
jgi:GNAT superfamily N-acetyltransferase